jgi:Flp pilus assembly protein CpaB
VARTLPPVPWRRAVRRARRSAALRWLLVAVAAAAVALEGSRIGAEAAAERDAWGTTVEVVVVRRAVDAGDAITGGDVAVEPWPEAIVPEGALRSLPPGAVASAALLPGEAVLAARVAPAGSGPVAALVPTGWRAVAVPTSASGFGTPAPPLEVGDRVDLLAPDPVATGAVVVAVDDAAVTVAVPADDAPALAEALAATVVTVVLRGPA